MVTGITLAIASLVWMYLIQWDVLDEGIGIIIIPTIIFFLSLAFAWWGWSDWKNQRS
jgi:hypothetical protein